MAEQRDPTVDITRGLRRRIRAAGKKRKPTKGIKYMVNEACEALLKAEKANK